MATREAPEEREKGDQSSSSAPHIIRSQQATANVTTTNNFINCGQVVQLTGPNNTVIMTGNRVQLMQQTNQVQYSPPVQSRQTTTSQSTTTTTTGDPTRRCSESRDGLPIDDHNMCSVTYAQGPPNRLEIVALTTKLTGSVGLDWKLLAVPLSIPDHEVMSIEHDERTLKMKINTLLVKWVDRDENNDRTKLARLLGSMEGFNLAYHCRESLQTE